MDLPKNITQIGEANRTCKVYAEDYVISYMKQLNIPAQDKDMAVALYGVRKEENEIPYIFLYGACKLDFLQRESRHLSQAQQQEIEKLRRRYFAEYEFMGYRLLNGEMIEGFHICENGVCRYVEGYAQFYEKNDGMLAYMLDTRKGEAVPEEFHQEKYEMVKRRQEERREQAAGHPRGLGENVIFMPKAGQTVLGERSSKEKHGQRQPDKSMRHIRFSAVTVFALLCVAGLLGMQGNKSWNELQLAARQAFGEISAQQIPDATQAVNAAVQVDTIVAEDRLTEALQKENEALSESTEPLPSAPAQEASATDTENTEKTEVQNLPAPAEPDTQSPPAGTDSDTQNPAAAAEPDTQNPAAKPEVSASAETGETAESESREASAPVGYIIQQGDTLIAISLRQYGSDVRVREICSLNGIDNPDDIKVGQKILLP